MRPAALPRGARQHRADRVHQPGVVVAGHQVDPGEAAGDQAAQEREPAGAVLGAGDVQAEDSRWPPTLTPMACRQHVDGASAFSALLRQRVDHHEGVGPAIKPPVAEAVRELVQLGGHRADGPQRPGRDETTSSTAGSKEISGVPQAIRSACSQGRWTDRNGTSSAIQSRKSRTVGDSPGRPTRARLRRSVSVHQPEPRATRR